MHKLTNLYFNIHIHKKVGISLENITRVLIYTYLHGIQIE